MAKTNDRSNVWKQFLKECWKIVEEKGEPVNPWTVGNDLFGTEPVGIESTNNILREVSQQGLALVTLDHRELRFTKIGRKFIGKAKQDEHE